MAGYFRRWRRGRGKRILLGLFRNRNTRNRRCSFSFRTYSVFGISATLRVADVTKMFTISAYIASQIFPFSAPDSRMNGMNGNQYGLVGIYFVENFATIATRACEDTIVLRSPLPYSIPLPKYAFLGN